MGGSPSNETLIREQCLAAALQHRLLELRQNDFGGSPDKLNLFYAIDPNVIDVYLDPADRAFGGAGRDQRLGVGDALPVSETGPSKHQSRERAIAEAVSASIARFIFELRDDPAPLFIPRAFADDTADLVQAITKRAQKGLTKKGREELLASRKLLVGRIFKGSKGDELQSRLEAITQILFLDSNDYRKFEKLKLLTSKRIFASEFMLQDKNSGNEAHLLKASQSLRTFEAIANIHDYRTVFQRAFDRVAPPPSDKESEQRKRRWRNRRLAITEALAETTWINRSLEQMGKNNRLILITLDNRILNLCQYVAFEPDGNSSTLTFYETPVSNSILELNIRHPRCFLNDRGVLPSWEKESNTERGVVDIGEMYQGLIGHFEQESSDKFNTTSVAPSSSFQMGEGHIILSKYQNERLEKFIEVNGTLAIEEVQRLREVLTTTLQKAAELPSDDTLIRLRELLKKDSEVTDQTMEKIVEELMQVRGTLEKSYEDSWRSLMAESFDTFFFTQKLTSLDRPSRAVANLCHNGTPSIEKFIAFTNSLLESPFLTEDRRSRAFTKYHSLIEQLKEDDDTYYSLALAHAYAYATLGEWDTCIAACRFALSCVEEHLRNAESLDGYGSNGREAYFYLAYAFRHTARSDRHFENCRNLIENAKSVLLKEEKGTDVHFDIVPERFDVELTALDMTKALLANHDNSEIAPSNLSFAQLSKHILEQIRALTDSLNVPQDKSEDSEARRIREKCRERLYVNLFALGLQFEVSEPAARRAWPEFWRIYNEEIELRGLNFYGGSRSFFSTFVIQLSKVIFGNNKPGQSDLEGLKNIWFDREKNYVFLYDPERYNALLRLLPNEIRSQLEKPN